MFGTSLTEEQVYDDLSKKYTQALAQSMMNTGANALQNMYKTPPPQPQRNPNNCEAYVMPLSSLVNLWRAKFGDKWVDVSTLDDEFWSDASARLHKNKMMEESDMNNEPWARLREGV